MLGPHFHFDLIRLARKGWPTVLRVVYLSILLIGLTAMYRSTGDLVLPKDFARRAQSYANMLVVLQDVLVLLFLPVYVASSIAEEKENRTLEILFLSFLTDRELVLGKLWARICHLGAIALASFPLLVFMHLWGNVDIAFLLFHEVNTYLLLITGGSICILISTQSETTFQAITRSYPWLALLGLAGIIVAFFFSFNIVEVMARRSGTGGNSGPWYLGVLALLVPCHFLVTWALLRTTIALMSQVRREESRRPKKITGAFALTDNRTPAPARRPRPRPRPSTLVHEYRPITFGIAAEQAATPQRKTPRVGMSNIHPLALPIGGSALFWKECLKDGTSWSLRFGWLGLGLLVILVPAIAYRLIYHLVPEMHRTDLRGICAAFTYTSYFLCVAAYVLVVVFQTTLSVAGEREQDTLVFLQLIPESARLILFCKWLGPLWRNWPILAIGYLGALMGLGCGIYSLKTALIMCLLPWPFLLMLSFLALCLSVMCRRVLFANVILIGFLLALFVGHIAAAGQIGMILPFYIAVLFETRLWFVDLFLTGSPWERPDFPWNDAFVLACAQQGAFVVMAFGCALLAFWRFQKRDYAFS